MELLTWAEVLARCQHVIAFFFPLLRRQLRLFQQAVSPASNLVEFADTDIGMLRLTQPKLC